MKFISNSNNNYEIVQAIDRTLCNRSTNQPRNQSIIQSATQSISQSVNSINHANQSTQHINMLINTGTYSSHRATTHSSMQAIQPISQPTHQVNPNKHSINQPIKSNQINQLNQTINHYINSS